ncbi:MAG: hypothetical protein IJX18_03690, partial [Clostridia bacterium]|nr:hypothetical protein [Clostridia bacterium]
EHLYLTRSKSRFLYGKREPSARSCFIKELSSLLDLPKERPRYNRYESSYGDDDFYSNSTYGAARYDGGRYGDNSSYGYKKSGYGYGNSAIKRSVYREETYNTYSPANPSVYGGQKDSGFSYGGSTPAKPKVEKTVNVGLFQIGMVVSHAKFGTGTIVGVHGAGNNTILDVAFSGGYGIKQLSASIAPLTILK